MTSTSLATLAAFALTLCAQSAIAQSLDSEVPRANAAVDSPAPGPASNAAPSAPAALPPLDARTYHERAIVLFATAALGYGVTPGINPYFNPGINLSFTVRNVWGGFVLDTSLDLTASALCFGRNCPAIQVQPAVRAGYSGSVSSSVALGVRAGYAPAFAVSVPGGAGFLHQVDGDLHTTIVTRRGAIIEPFLAGGVLIGGDQSGRVAPFPVANLGLRIGAAL
jgi:hypothetical protein